MSWIVMLCHVNIVRKAPGDSWLSWLNDSHFWLLVFLVLGHFEDFAADSDSSQDVIFVGLPKIWETHGDPPRDTMGYILVMTNIAIENGHRNSGFSH